MNQACVSVSIMAVEHAHANAAGVFSIRINAAVQLPLQLKYTAHMQEANAFYATIELKCLVSASIFHNSFFFFRANRNDISVRFIDTITI